MIVVPGQKSFKILNEVGGRIWSLLDGTRTPEDIARVLTSEYDVTEEQALADVLEFLEELDDAGLLNAGNQR